MAVLKQGTQVRFKSESLQAYRQKEDRSLEPTEHRVARGDRGFWVSALPPNSEGGEVHVIGVTVDDEVLMVPADRTWFEVVS